LLVFLADQTKHGIDIGSQTVLALSLMKIDAAADRKVGVDPPRIDPDQPGEVFRHLI